MSSGLTINAYANMDSNIENIVGGNGTENNPNNENTTPETTTPNTSTNPSTTPEENLD